MDVAFVYVENVPQVKLSLDPVTPVSEPKKENVTLTCSSRFLDGKLLKELPDCNLK